MLNLILWGVVFAVMVILELASMQLVSIWFAAGAAAGFVTSLLGFGTGLQLFMFILVSILLLSVTRPILKKFTVGKIQPTNSELDIGKTATVIEKIDNMTGTGRVRLNGVDWKAVSEDGSIIEDGSVVRVESVNGAKLFVSLYIDEKAEVN